MPSADLPQDASPVPHHRRSREEVEALAKNFVATPGQDEAPSKSRSMLLAGAAGVLMLAGGGAYLAWPASQQVERPAAEPGRVATSEVEELRQRLEAERERQRQELQAGADYMAKMAAADAALVKDLSARADKLAGREAAQATAAAPSRPASAASPDPLPTPRDEAAPSAAPAKSTAVAMTAAAAPATPQKAAATAAPQPQKAAPEAAAPTVVAQAPKASCSIHVSELSSTGKLTYEGIKKVKGVRIDEASGHVFTPPVQARGGRVVFEVMPDGCVQVVRSLDR